VLVLNSPHFTLLIVSVFLFLRTLKPRQIRVKQLDTRLELLNAYDQN